MNQAARIAVPAAPSILQEAADRRMKPKLLIVNADDYGLSFGITDGILHAHNAGVVTSASLIANQPASVYAIESLQKFPRLGVGVHLNLSHGRPVSAPSEVPSLVTADGTFYPTADIVARLKKWQVSHRDIEKEFRAQIRWLKMRGVQPTHADSHNHIHFYPCAIDAFRRAAQAEDIRCTRAPRHLYSPASGWGEPHAGGLYRRIVLTAYRAIVQSVVLHGLKVPDFSLLPHPEYLTNGKTPKEAWMVTLANLGPGTYELSCHPGLPEVGFAEFDSIHEQRERELKVLTDCGFRNVILANGFKLANYRDLIDSAAKANHSQGISMMDG